MNEKYSVFENLIRNQFEFGGKKYSPVGNSAKEATDVLFDKHGFAWLVGTIDKYTFRFSNMGAEKDLLKISCYSYLIWIKRGFQINKNGINDPPIDMNTELKSKYFPEFVKITRRDFFANSAFYNNENFNIISNQLGTWSKGKWSDIKEGQIITIFNLCFIEWSKRFSKVEKHNTDTDIDKPIREREENGKESTEKM